MAKWIKKPIEFDTKQVADILNIEEVTACVLARGEITNREEAIEYIEAKKIDRQAIFNMKDGEIAVDLVVQAIRDNKNIVIYGDYDIDGVTSCTILYKAMKAVGGGKISFYAPHRQVEGYGLNIKAVEKLHEQGCQVIVTCDNGIASLGEIKKARELGIDVVVLDHHEPPFEEDENGNRKDVLPEANAIVDHKRADCPYPFKALCAGGISFYFALALMNKFGVVDGNLERELITFAAIATIGDIVDLVGENRNIAKIGLRELNNTSNIGLQTLIANSGTRDKILTEHHVGYIIGPCINAAGRLESANIAIELFTTNIQKKAKEIAKELVNINKERKSMTEDCKQEMIASVRSQETLDKIIVLYNSEIHESIAGIVAGKVKEEFNHPTIVITKSEDGAKGSGRSIKPYNMFEALFEHGDLFNKFGGHSMAAGFSIDEDKIPVLREKLNESCKLQDEDFELKYEVYDILDFSQITLKLENEISWFAPFGKANRMPMFASLNLIVESLRAVGKNKDILQIGLKDEKTGKYLRGIAFYKVNVLREMLKELYNDEMCDKILEDGKMEERIDIVYTIEKNEFQGNTSVELNIKDLRLSK